MPKRKQMTINRTRWNYPITDIKRDRPKNGLEKTDIERTERPEMAILRKRRRKRLTPSWALTSGKK